MVLAATSPLITSPLATPGCGSESGPHGGTAWLHGTGAGAGVAAGAGTAAGGVCASAAAAKAARSAMAAPVCRVITVSSCRCRGSGVLDDGASGVAGAARGGQT